MPVFVILLKEKRVTLLLIGVVIIQVLSMVLGYSLWNCPVKTTLGFPCPGCGLSTATILFFRKEFSIALSAHLFAPVFLAGFGFAVVSILLPSRQHGKLVQWIEKVEIRTGFFAYILFSLLVYWAVKFIL